MTPARKPLRFVLVGLANTALDFGLLFVLRALGLPVVPANMVSTGVALTFSFFANRSFTFRAAGSGSVTRQGVMFVAVTLVGLWGLQPLVLLAGEALLEPALGNPATLLISKVLATVVSMIWNFLLYDRIVFRTRKDRND